MAKEKGKLNPYQGAQEAHINGVLKSHADCEHPLCGCRHCRASHHVDDPSTCAVHGCECKNFVAITGQEIASFPPSVILDEAQRTIYDRTSIPPATPMGTPLECTDIGPPEDPDLDPVVVPEELDSITAALRTRWNRQLSPRLTNALISAGVTSEETENAIDRIRDFYDGDTAQAFAKEHILERVLIRGQRLEDLLESTPRGILDKSVGMALLVLALVASSFGCATANDRAKLVLVSAGDTYAHVRDAHEEAGQLLYAAGKECQDAVKAKPGGTDLPPVTAANVGAVMAQCAEVKKPLPFDPVKFSSMADVLAKSKGAIWQGNELRQKLANAGGDQSQVWGAIADAVAYLAQTYLLGRELGFSLQQEDLVSLQKAAAKR